MIENNNFPWYLQQSSTFTTLYYGFFPVAEVASPLAFGDAFNVDRATGKMLFRLGTYWGMNGDNTVWDGLIYDIDNWSEVKVWTGGVKRIEEDLYRNIIKAKSYAFGRLYSLTTLKGVLDLIFAGVDCDYQVYEGEIEQSIDLGFINQQVEESEDYGSVADATISSLNYGTLVQKINRITIVLTATHDIIRTFIEIKAFDLTFIGKPVGIKVNWQYNYTD